MARSNPFLDGALRVLRDVATRALTRATRPDSRARRDRDEAPADDRQRRREPRPQRDDRAQKERPRQETTPREQRRDAKGGYPGDFTGTPGIVYQPHDDGRADPGEVVWTWVPYEEDHAQGKDRPVLIIARDGAWLLGLQVTSQDHDRDAAQEARAGRFWVDIGAGAWDNQHRPSEARVNRIIRIDPDAVRRIGAILDEAIFTEVAREVLRHY